MAYNQFNRKYTANDIREVYLTCKSITEFLNTGLKKSAIFYGIMDEITQYFSDIRKEKQNNFKNTTTKLITDTMQEYSAITEFKRHHPKLYYYWNKWKMPSPYIKQKISLPQIIVSHFYSYIFQEVPDIDNRKILDGKELDIYFSKFNIAIEYNGWYWHKNKIKQDAQKRKLCDDRGILLIVIQEPSNLAFQDRELLLKFVRDDFIQNIQLIEKHIGKSLNVDLVKEFKIDEFKLMSNIFSYRDINHLIETCDRYSKVKTEHNRIWQYLCRNRLIYLLDPIKQRDYIYMDKNSFKVFVKSKFSNYSMFVKHKCYKVALKRGYIPEIRELYFGISP